MLRHAMLYRTFLCLLLPGIFVAAPIAVADESEGTAICEESRINSAKQFLGCVELDQVRKHLVALQEIANNNGGIRSSGTPGYDESVEYVAGVMRAFGYNVEIQPFQFDVFTPLGPSSLEQIAPNAVEYEEGLDFLLMGFSVAANVAGSVAAVDLDLGRGNQSTSGCEVEDFAGFPAGSIALIQRGACSFQQKAENAADAGAIGAIIFNQGDTDDRVGVINGTLTGGYSGGIPVMFARYGLGEEWASTAGLELSIAVDVSIDTVTTANVLAETPGGFDDNVVMIGAHLDSVDLGPGLQDNGSGAAAILEAAIQLTKVRNNNKVRFAWWGAEEFGLIGSDYYVGTLAQEELDNIAMYLNYDMIASPNHVNFVYDGDGSDFGLPGPDGSAYIEDFFSAWYTRSGLASEATEISFLSDYAAFFDLGIPFGGLFSGANGIKTAEQQLKYGGRAGVPYDACYHSACDTIDNISEEVLEVNIDAVAAATYWFSLSTGLVNGVTPENHGNPAPVSTSTEGRPDFDSGRAETENLGPLKIR